MLFNSYIFIFAFLPICLLGFFSLGRLGWIQAAIAWLVVCSLFFYGWWNPVYLILIAASIVINFYLGKYISLHRNKSIRKTVMLVGVVLNLAALGYFKYTDFMISSINAVLDTHYSLTGIILPLAISFFTFQQIAYLVDAYRDEAHEYSFLHYCLFVSFFPQLIAGPIVHHKEMLPQFAQRNTFFPSAENFSIGLTIFTIGLFKKVVLADSIAEYATPVFSAAESGMEVKLYDAWAGALAYTMQIYFDFSGYSDMAIGLARLFGVKLPLNFDSPYKSRNIIDFWRRWHMTLSRFLRDYLYITLGGNRYGKLKRYRNLFLTMLLGGIWHGAGWNFAIWGALHGSYLIINHGWNFFVQQRQFPAIPAFIKHGAAVLVTFLAVVIAWVFFRAVSFDAALLILKGMFGLHGIPDEQYLYFSQITDSDFIKWFVPLLLIAWFAPNSQQMMRHFEPALGVHSDSYTGKLVWRPSVLWSLMMAALGAYAILNLTRVSEFLYFQF